jgi:hypothetical protein
LLPFSPPVSGVFPHHFLCQGRFTHTTVRAQPGPVDTLSFIIAFQSGNPHGLEEPLFAPEPEMPVYGSWGSKLFGYGLPLDSSTQDMEDCFNGLAAVHGGTARSGLSVAFSGALFSALTASRLPGTHRLFPMTAIVSFFPLWFHIGA